MLSVSVAVGLIEVITSHSVQTEMKIVLGMGGSLFLYAITLLVFQRQSSAVCPNCQKPVCYSTGGEHFILATNVPKKCKFCGEPF